MIRLACGCVYGGTALISDEEGPSPLGAVPFLSDAEGPIPLGAVPFPKQVALGCLEKVAEHNSSSKPTSSISSWNSFMVSALSPCPDFPQ